MTEEEWQARDRLHVYWREPPNPGKGPRVMWDYRELDSHISTLAILQRPQFFHARNFCMRFNHATGCADPKCKHDHQCLFCGCSDRDRCAFRQGLEEERARFYEQYGQDPCDPSEPGMGSTDANLQASLQRLSQDAPKKVPKKAGSRESNVRNEHKCELPTGKFAPLLEDTWLRFLRPVFSPSNVERF
eukprot:Skav232083  [mRNA]  locus=scaffold2353:6811:7374:+ [translate_table: standard]